MRDPKRIDGLWKRIATLHKQNPDLRVSQFLMNLLAKLGFDPFYMEDEEFVSKLEEICYSSEDNGEKK